LAHIAWAEGDYTLAKEKANYVRANYTEVQVWAEATLMVARIQLAEQEVSLSIETLEKAIELTLALKPGDHVDAGACTMLTVVPKTLCKLYTAMARLHAEGLNLSGRAGDPTITADSLELTMAFYGQAEDTAKGMKDPQQLLELCLERGELLLSLPTNLKESGVYQTKQVVDELLEEFTLQRGVCQGILHEKTLANNDTRAALTSSTWLSRLETQISRCYMMLSYMDEQVPESCY